mgnify:CR=1 FL=1
MYLYENKGTVAYGPLIALVNTHFGHMGVMHKPSIIGMLHESQTGFHLLDIALATIKI